MDYGVVNMQLLLQASLPGGKAWGSTSNTYFVSSDQPVGPDLFAEFTSAAEYLFDRVRDVMGGRDIYCMVHARPRGTSTFPEFTDEVALFDGGYVTAGPFWATLLVKKFVGSPERYKSGRAYIPFIGEPLTRAPLLPDGTWGSTPLSTAFAETITSGTMTLQPVVWDGRTDTFEVVTRCEVSQFLAFQRRRNASQRYYAFP